MHDRLAFVGIWSGARFVGVICDVSALKLLDSQDLIGVAPIVGSHQRKELIDSVDDVLRDRVISISVVCRQDSLNERFVKTAGA